MRKFLYIALFVIWTVVCVYGTYRSTVRSAEVYSVADGYEVVYHNTGEIHSYR